MDAHHQQESSLEIDLRVSPLQLSNITAVPTAALIDAPELPATFRGDGYRVPPRRVDVASAPLSAADVRITAGSLSLSEVRHYQNHHVHGTYKNGDENFNKSPRVQRLHPTNNDSNEAAPEFPVLLGNVSSYSTMMPSNNNKDPPFPSTSYPPKYGFNNCISGNPHNSFMAPNAPPGYPIANSPNPYTAWGSLPLVSQSPPMSQQPSFLLPPSPYVNDVGNISFRPNVAASSSTHRQLLTPPTAHTQVHPPNSQPIDCKIGHSVPAPQCPVLSGHHPGSIPLHPSQHARSMTSHTAMDGYTYNPSYHYGSTYLPPPPPTHPAMMPHFAAYPQYEEEGWIESGQPGYGYYPLEHPFQYNGCTLVPLSPSYISSSMQNNKLPMSTNNVFGQDGEPLWYPASSTSHPCHQSNYYPSTRRVINQNRIGITPPLKDIESRVAPEHPTRHMKTIPNDISTNDTAQYQQLRPPTAVRRTTTAWGQPAPSQEPRNSKKWWMFCSSV